MPRQLFRRLRAIVATLALPLVAGCTFVQARTPPTCSSAVSVSAPMVDHHQHLLSEPERRATVEYVRQRGSTDYARQVEVEPLVDADQLVQMLDSAGIGKAVVLSSAYYLTRTATERPGELEALRADEAWTLAQVQRHPTRLVATCSVNPLRGYAPGEIERCASAGSFRAIKMHFDASGVDFANASHVASVRRAFATANRVKLPVIVHIQTETGYGAAQARTFLNEMLPAASDVPVTINHLWGGGIYAGAGAEALTELAAAVQRGDPQTKNLWFDVAQAAQMATTTRERKEVAERMRQIGFGRLLYGSDGPQWSGSQPKEQWAQFSTCMPLSPAEFDSLGRNAAPYLH